MTKFTDIFFFDYFETKKTQTGEEPQYRFDGPRAPEDLRYYMNRSNIFGQYVKFDHVIFERFKVSINIHRLYFRDTSQSQFRLISCTRSFLLMNVRPKKQIPNKIFRRFFLSEPCWGIHGRGLGSDNQMGRQTPSME